ncbi:hypothetical protein [Pseudomonas urethralis]|uniref:hypothetical protein n=1 Tax=Pseudomonas urethralis TaxID=2740517 RepID=UPI0015968769|nr:hypothetical protein [Pseudomonas urethralis]
MKPKAPDILDDMSKGELVDWIRQFCFGRPKRSDVLYIRWLRLSGKLEADRAEALKELNAMDLGQRDRLWSQYNQEPDRKKKLKILDQITAFNERAARNSKEWEALERRQKKVDALYDQIDIARHTEGHRLLGVA